MDQSRQDFEDWITDFSRGNADLSISLNGQYDDPSIEFYFDIWSAAQKCAFRIAE